MLGNSCWAFRAFLDSTFSVLSASASALRPLACSEARASAAAAALKRNAASFSLTSAAASLSLAMREASATSACCLLTTPSVNQSKLKKTQQRMRNCQRQEGGKAPGQVNFEKTASGVRFLYLQLVKSFLKFCLSILFWISIYIPP